MFDVWKNVLAEIEAKISPEQFKTFFPDTAIVSNDDGVVVVGVRNVFFITAFNNKYRDLITTALKNNNIDVKKLSFVINNSAPKKKAHEIKRVSVPEKPRINTSIKPAQNSGLNPNYTLENFIIGTNNDLAASVAKSVIEHPGEKYNPFFLYGKPGVGKTHLVCAIGNEIIRKRPDAKVLYIPMNRFYSEFINSIRNNRGDAFTKKFEGLDVLIVDDFQQIIGKDKSQEEFFNIFNDMYQSGKQVIITCDRLPAQLEKLDSRLTSRLESAGSYDIQMPSFEDRCAILQAKAEYDGVEIEEEAIHYIAENIKTNVRALEGEYNRIMAMAELRGKSPMALIRDGLIDTAHTSGGFGGSITPKKIVEKVAKFYDLSVAEMCSKSRVSNIKTARQVAMYLISTELSLSTPKIASEVGVKDHTTVMHGISKIKEDIKLNFALREQINELRSKLYE